MKKIIQVIFLCCSVGLSQISAAASFPLGLADESRIAVAYQGSEKLVYRVSWSGGVKIGELHMEVNRLQGNDERYELRARVKGSGVFHFFYPVDDSFVTVVEGDNRLPVSYEVHQKEGRNYEAMRYTEYDQKNGKIRYRKNDQQPVEYEETGEVHNEFSSFFFTRILQLVPEQAVVVPTFADGKRHDVVVRIGKQTRIHGTVRGDVNVLQVTPIMDFKGLYDKEGDTTFWLTDDLCRVPVRINSKILIGSLTAELVFYSNPFCTDQSDYHATIHEHMQQEEKLILGD
ncbi:MAG: DUF3108 domain-containing protein [Desulfocapsa sp.]|nr:DUF3108 domain-containing protein [Desulfocapsa sp.]